MYKHEYKIINNEDKDLYVYKYNFLCMPVYTCVHRCVCVYTYSYVYMVNQN